MVTIKHILFPVDFSERMEATAPFVRNVAHRFGANITLLAVMPPFWDAPIAPVAGLMLPGGPMALNLEELRSSLETRLKGALPTELNGIPVRRVAELGDPAQSITQFAQSEGVDLIMMATHGYGRFRSLLLGSVASKVLHDAECPVWTASHTSDPASGEHAECKTVVCAVDGTPKSVPVMEWAAEYAKSMGAKLRLVHAVPGASAWPERQMNREFEAFLVSSARETIERQMKASSIPSLSNVPLSVVSGDIAASVREEALRHDADLVILGRGLLDETLGRLRTHTYGVIRSAPCPVISV